MIALLFLALTFLVGRQVFIRLVPKPSALIGSLGLKQSLSENLSPWIMFCASLITGLLGMTLFVYVAAVVSSSLLPESLYPLLTANSLAIVGAITLLILDWRRTPHLRPAPLPTDREAWISLLSRHGFFWLSCLLFTLFGAWLAFTSFSRSGSIVSAGSSVFSDFAPHTALVSSFAKGSNFPAGYPHFAGDGIAYHFLFYFLCGNLHYLGLPIDWAINLPSILTLVVFSCLLGALAVAVTRERAAFLLTPFLMFFRSSFAFLTRLRDLVTQPGATITSVLRQVMTARKFIGDTPRDDWGLWGLNVYANQRHLLLGFGALIVVLLLFFPMVRPSGKQAAKTTSVPEDKWSRPDRESWFPMEQDRGRLIAALIIVVLLPYFHGSALVALMTMLCGLFLFSRARAAHILVCVAGLVSALVQGRLFRAGGAFIEPQFLFGFIAEDKSLTGILSYLFEMSGLVLPLALIAVLLAQRNARFLFISLLPLVFGFTFSLTPDVTVNHKYLMFTFTLCSILVAGLIIRLWKGLGRFPQPRRALAVMLLLVLTMTGFMELIIYRNINQIRVDANLASPLNAYVEKNTPPRSVFVTAPLHYHSLLFTGRQIYFGHAYYAWSAGHDTFTRDIMERDFLAAVGNDLAESNHFIAMEGVDYLIIDDQLRHHPELVVNEAFFRENYRQVASFPSLGNLLILDLHQPIHP